MSYVVLARKWRPRFFEEVVGQGHVAQTLKNAIDQDRVAHAYLFTGSRGVGKTTTARLLAKALNCHNGPTKVPCYECHSCKEISAGQAIDVFEIDGASNRGINEIRELREGARYAPNRDRFKIYIIDEVHMLTTEAFNALLKTLEEPPPHVKFIFATTEPQKIPITILSRCQRFDFKRINQQDIVHHLEQICTQEKIETDKAGLQLIARQAAGGMRDALSLLDQVISFAGMNINEAQVTQILGVANRKHLFALSTAVLSRDTQRALLCLDEVHRYGYDLSQFVHELVQHFRDLTVTKAVKEPGRVTDLTQTELEHVHAIIEQVPADLLHRCFQTMVQGAQEMSKSTYPKLIFEMTLVRMCQLEPLIGLDLLVDKLQDLEELLGDEGDKKKIEPLSIPAPTFEPPTPQAAPQPVETSTKIVAPPEVPSPFESGPEPTPQPAPVVDTVVEASIETRPIGTSPVESPAPVVAKTPVPTPAPPAPNPPTVQNKPIVPSPFEPIEADEPQTSAFKAPEFTAPDILDEPVQEHETHVDEVPEDESIFIPDLPDWMQEDAQKAAVISLLESGVPVLDLKELDSDQAWKAVVDYIRRDTAPLAATLEHAYIEHFDESLLKLSFVDQYHHFIHDEIRTGVFKNHLYKIFGDDFQVEIDLNTSQDLDKSRTLAQWREVAIQAKEARMHKATQAHPVVVEAMALFEPLRCTIHIEVND